jgi:ABC-type sugar transport system substrate-binding protein
MVIHDTGNSFFSVMDRAAQDAAKQLGVQVDFMGPPTFDITRQIGMIETAIDSGYDGIAFSAPDPAAFDRIYQRANQKGIKMIAFNTDAPNARDAFVGQDLIRSGYMQAKWMFENVMNGRGKVVICTCAPGHTALEERIEGIKNAMREFPNVELINIIDITGDLTRAYSVIENAYTGNPSITAFFGVDVYSEAVGTFISRNNLTGKVHGAGFDLTEGTLKHVESGAMQLTVGQNPYLQGYVPSHELGLYTTKDISPVNVDTGLEMVTKANVKEYLSRME